MCRILKKITALFLLFVTVSLNAAPVLVDELEPIAPSFQEKNILPNATYETPAFWMHIGKDRLWNKYGGNMPARQIFKGGSATKDFGPRFGVKE
ncbi:MAG: hypothetical protein J6R96_04460 [Spirochaetaceae bacterium]|nr:hypothetical protein [Spirochaetaceae bacterium]